MTEEKEEKVTAEGEVNTGQEDMDTEEMVDKEIEQFRHYLKEYMGIDPDKFDEYLDKEDYVKMIVEGLYNQYVARMMEHQQKMMEQQKEQEEGNRKVKKPSQL